MSRLRLPQVWVGGDGTPYVFTAYDVVHPPPPPPHPWSATELRRYARRATGREKTSMMAFDLRTSVVYASSEGRPM
eukprot:gene6147-7588_t